MTRLIVRPAAEADILDAQIWYSTRNGALADRFIDELRSTLSRVATCLASSPTWEVPGARCFTDFRTPSTSSCPTTRRRSWSPSYTKAERPWRGRGASEAKAKVSAAVPHAGPPRDSAPRSPATVPAGLTSKPSVLPRTAIASSDARAVSFVECFSRPILASTVSYQIKGEDT